MLIQWKSVHFRALIFLNKIHFVPFLILCSRVTWFGRSNNDSEAFPTSMELMFTVIKIKLQQWGQSLWPAEPPEMNSKLPQVSTQARFLTAAMRGRRLRAAGTTEWNTDKGTQSSGSGTGFQVSRRLFNPAQSQLSNCVLLWSVNQQYDGHQMSEGETIDYN